MIKYLILLLCIYLCQSRCVLSYEEIDTIPINKISLVPINFSNTNNVENVADPIITMKSKPIYFIFIVYTNDSERPHVYENMTRLDINIDSLSINTTLVIQWLNITTMSQSPYFNMFHLYINERKIKPISMASKSYGYVSYINNECGSDIYDIITYDITGPYMLDFPILIFKLDTSKTYVNWKV